MNRPLLTPADVRRLLAEHGLAPRKARGQNFVIDPNTVRKTVRDAGVQPGDLVCEVGPGLGSLTLALREAGARVLAVEVDPGMAAALAEVVGDDTGVRIVQADAVRVDFTQLCAGRPALLVSNLPFNVATPVVMRALESGAFHRLHVMVQREVGHRWAAGAGDAGYGAVSVKIAALADARVVARVSRAAFHPVPNVDSVTVTLTPTPWREAVDRAALFRLVERGFGQRRKRLRNALSTDDLPPADVEAALAAAGLDPGARAEELGLEAWVRLVAVLAVG